MTRTIVVAGATGSLGRAACRVLSARGHRVRAIVRRESARVDGAHSCVVADGLRPETLPAAVEGAQAVLSCMGAPIVPRPGGGRAGFEAVDTVANLHLLRAAESAGLERFTYVSVAGGRGPLSDLAYVRAHEAVVDALRPSSLHHAVVRPTGFFSAFELFVTLARWAPVPVLGDPTARTNPIATEDLAEVCADAVEDPGFGERAVGGPDVVTRRDIADLARAAAGRSAASFRVPAGLARFGAWGLRWLHPRLAESIEFFARVGTVDGIAPAHGRRSLEAWFRTLSEPA